jgi:hypothetical protein
MFRRRKPLTSERLLEILAQEGEMRAQAFLAMVPRSRGDYIDFYPAAALMHAGYISSDSTHDRGNEKIRGKFGFSTQNIAQFMCQLVLPPGETLKIEGFPPRESAHNFPVKVFMTSEGYLRLDELRERRSDRRRKRIDYSIAFVVAIVAAIFSSYLAHRFALDRLAFEREALRPAATATGKK